MIGLIVTGHGHFASAITSSIRLIAGDQPNYFAVDFDGEGTSKLENDLKAAIDKLKDNSGIIIFSDLAGGSPFKTAVTLANGNPNIRVLCGTNLPMLCEIAMARTMIDDLDTLVTTAINVGKEGVQEFEMPEIHNGPAEGEDGI